MLASLLIALASMAPNQAIFEADHVNIKVDIQSNIFKYEVTNLGTSPIVRFEVKHHAAYNFKAPEGWEKQITPNLFQASTNDIQTAIYPNKTAEFSMRVSSRGAVLGRAPVKIRFQSGEAVAIPNVWSPAPEPQNYVILVGFLVLFIVLLHTAVLVYKERCRKQMPISDA